MRIFKLINIELAIGNTQFSLNGLKILTCGEWKDKFLLYVVILD